MAVRNIWIALALVVVSGCAHKSKVTPEADPGTSPPAQATASGTSTPAVEAALEGTCKVAELDSCEAELEAVARCFHACVTAAQKEPGEMPLVAFIAEHAAGEACESLEIEKKCGKLVLSGGGEIVHEHEMTSHDNFGDHDVMHIVYTFSAESCPEKAKTEIELHI
ncbi:MAG: hypothetical protein JRG91_10615 [Deltaproteobacteria bacterium]|nr:hypothetical protein [Deltaproteobacteria bacterium]